MEFQELCHEATKKLANEKLKTLKDTRTMLVFTLPNAPEELKVHNLIFDDLKNNIKITIVCKHLYFTQNRIEDILALLPDLNRSISIGSLKYDSNIKCIKFINYMPKDCIPPQFYLPCLSHIIFKSLETYESYLKNVKSLKSTSDLNLKGIMFPFKDILDVWKNKDNSDLQSYSFEIEDADQLKYSDESSGEFAEPQSETEDEVKVIKNSQRIIKRLEKKYAMKYFDEMFFDRETLEYEYNPNSTIANLLVDHTISEKCTEEIMLILEGLSKLSLQFHEVNLKNFMGATKCNEIISAKYALIFDENKHIKTWFTATKNLQNHEQYLTEMKEKLLEKLANSLNSDYCLNFPTEYLFSRDSFPENLKSLSLLGKGGFSEVYEGEYLKKRVAIKISTEEKKKSLRRSMHELLILNRLSHKNIIKALGLVKDNGIYCLVMEYCESQSLKSKLESPYQKKLEWMMEIADALMYMHSHGIIHCDLKPSNIMLNSEGRPKIIDFGLAMNLNKEINNFSGFTIIYASPEQIIGEEPGPHFDVWAFGMTFYHVITGKAPYFNHGDKYLRKTSSAKQKFLSLIKDNMAKPLIEEIFQREHPVETDIMNLCWDTNTKTRIDMKRIVEKLNVLKSY